MWDKNPNQLTALEQQASGSNSVKGDNLRRLKDLYSAGARNISIKS
jgi:hypothetical protein